MPPALGTGGVLSDPGLEPGRPRGERGPGNRRHPRSALATMVAKLEAVALLLQLSTLVLLSIADAHVNRHPAFCSWHQHKRAPSMPQSKRAAAARHAPRGSSLTVRRMSTSSGSRAFIEESEGIPLVYMAAQDGRPDVVSGLLESGYSPNQAVQGRTPVRAQARLSRSPPTIPTLAHVPPRPPLRGPCLYATFHLPPRHLRPSPTNLSPYLLAAMDRFEQRA